MNAALSDLGIAGPLLGLLALLSVLSIAIFLARLMALSGVTKGQDARTNWLDQVEDGNITAAPDHGTAADRVASRAANLLQKNVRPAALTADLVQMGDAEVAGMTRGIRMLELIGMISPLLGLLGTVLGMIQSFRSLELAQGAANAAILAGGIWQALLTTAAGLIVAIPAVVGAAILQARTEAGTREIETVIGRVALAQEICSKDAA